MQTDRIVLRPRSPAEAIELGLHLTRANWLSQIALMQALLLPVLLLGAGLALLFSPLLLLTLIWFKPTLDRALLHQLSNDLLARPAGAATILRQWRQWWFGGHAVSLLWRRFIPGRSVVLPIWQLERLKGARRNQRARSLNHNDRGSSTSLTFLASMVELTLLASTVALIVSFAPEQWTDGMQFFDWLAVNANVDSFWWLLALAYLPALALVEPFYVGAGFGIYLNQRSRLECWDLEPQLDALVARHHSRGHA
ncbi:MAG: hypothetical protein AAGJ52_08420 [Pseudomonadota bacterium]